MAEFKEFAKIGRLNREVIVTEKIDGTNGLTRDHIAYLKRGGDPDVPQIDRLESYWCPDEDEVDEY